MQPSRPLRGILLAGKLFLITTDGLARLAVVLDQALPKEQRAIAHPLERRAGVGHERDRLPLLLEVEDPADALALKRLVAHGEDLIEQQDISVDVDRH